MDWADGVGSVPEGRGAMGGTDASGAAGDVRPGRRALDDRLDTWVTRGRELVDGVSGTRPGARPPGRGGGGRLDGLGRWVEGKLDWLLDDREDWREPWQEGERSASPRAGGGSGEWSTPARAGGAGEWSAPARAGAADWGAGGERGELGGSGSAPVRPSRVPLEAISRRGLPAAQLSREPSSRQPQARRWTPPPPDVASPPSPASASSTPRAGAGDDERAAISPAPSQDWPEEDAFTVPRWRRQEPPPPPPVDPLAAAPAPAPPPGRPLPRSTRRR
jgi:hypothetical protein